MKDLSNFSGRLLSAFLTLADCGQFKLAADRFHVSQSAFSQMISRLEEQLGIRLFDRNTRQVLLTPEGKMLLPAARALATDVESMFADVRDHAAKKKGKVAIAALPSLSADWLPMILARYRQQYPGVKLQLFDTISDPNLELVRKGTVDFAINALAGDSQEFDTEFLFNEPYYFICLPDHPLAGKKSVSLRDLAGCDYIHSIRTGSLWRWIEPHARHIEFNDTGFEVAHLSTLAGLIANGIGQSIAPGLTLFQFHRLGLAAVPIRDRTLLRPLQMVKRRGQTLSVAASALLKMLTDNPPQHVHRPGSSGSRRKDS